MLLAATRTPLVHGRHPWVSLQFVLLPCKAVLREEVLLLLGLCPHPLAQWHTPLLIYSLFQCK